MAIVPIFKSMFSDLHYQMGKKSVLHFIAQRSGSLGVKEAIECFHQLSPTERDKLTCNAAALNGMGYVLLSMDRIDDAIELFKLNVYLFPEEANTYDSLGDGYYCSENYSRAFENYSKSIELNAHNPIVAKKIDELKKILGN